MAFIESHIPAAHRLNAKVLAHAESEVERL